LKHGLWANASVFLVIEAYYLLAVTQCSCFVFNPPHGTLVHNGVRVLGAMSLFRAFTQLGGALSFSAGEVYLDLAMFDADVFAFERGF
jgi:hypothetical protein